MCALGSVIDSLHVARRHPWPCPCSPAERERSAAHASATPASEGPAMLAPGASEWQAVHAGATVRNTTSPSAIGFLSRQHRIARLAAAPTWRLRPPGRRAAPRRCQDARAGHQDRPRRPALVVHLAHPVEKRDEVGDLGVAHVLLGHQPAMTLLVVELRRVTAGTPAGTPRRAAARSWSGRARSRRPRRTACGS